MNQLGEWWWRWSYTLGMAVDTLGLVKKEADDIAWSGCWFPGVISPVLDLSSVTSRIIIALSLSLSLSLHPCCQNAVKKSFILKRKKFETHFINFPPGWQNPLPSPHQILSLNEKVESIHMF